MRIAESIASQVQFLLQQEIDWDYLLTLANKHRFLPLLYRGLKEIYSGALPLAIASTLKISFLENTKKNLILNTELLRLLAFFEAEGISVIPYKGTVLAASIHSINRYLGL